MLLAELHGHNSQELADDEDFLTSTVFGHLRYVRPQLFWESLFSKALGLDTGKCRTLSDSLMVRGCEFTRLTTVDVYFWPKHEAFGVPDLLLYFSTGNSAPIVIVCEAKLWSEKSGFGVDDQLLRYLRTLRCLQSFVPPLPSEYLHSAVTAVLYITPRDSLRDVLDTVAECSNEPDLRDLLFRVQWQDIVEAADEAQPFADRVTKLVLCDVSNFLKRRGLEYFRGFSRRAFSTAGVGDGRFYNSDHEFAGFRLNAPAEPGFSGRFYDLTSATKPGPGGQPVAFEGFSLSGFRDNRSSVGRFYKMTSNEK